MLERPVTGTARPAADSSPAHGPINRALLARRLRALRWGVLVTGAAATAAFSTLAMHQTQAQSNTSAATADDGSVQQAPAQSGAPSQSLFDNAGGFSLAPGASASTRGRGGRDPNAQGSSAFGGTGSSTGGAANSGITSSGSGFGGSSSSGPSASQSNSSSAPTPSAGSSSSSGLGSSSSSSGSAFGGSSSFGGRSHTRTRTS